MLLFKIKEEAVRKKKCLDEKDLYRIYWDIRKKEKYYGEREYTGIYRSR